VVARYGKVGGRVIAVRLVELLVIILRFAETVGHVSRRDEMTENCLADRITEVFAPILEVLLASFFSTGRCLPCVRTNGESSWSRMIFSPHARSKWCWSGRVIR
jgi:hypothetical protein